MTESPVMAATGLLPAGAQAGDSLAKFGQLGGDVYLFKTSLDWSSGDFAVGTTAFAKVLPGWSLVIVQAADATHSIILGVNGAVFATY